MNPYVEEILKTDKKIVIALTGGGSVALSELLKYGGASNNLLAAHIPYSSQMFNRYVGHTFDSDFKYCSLEAANELAKRAWLDVSSWTDYPIESLLGVGASCSLAKNGPERAEREHRAYICIWDKDHVWDYEIVLNREFSYPDYIYKSRREYQEGLVGMVILKLLRNHCTGKHSIIIGNDEYKITCHDELRKN